MDSDIIESNKEKESQEGQVETIPEEAVKPVDVSPDGTLNTKESEGTYKEKQFDRDYPAGEAHFKKKKPYYNKRISYFIKNPDAPIDYKRVDILVRFLSDKGKITPRRFTGLSALHQRRVAKAIKRARHAGLLPYSYK